jgi:hypothetical protein
MDPMTNSIFIIFSAISPLLISFVKQSGFSRQVNAIIALICYVIVGFLGMLFSGEELSLENAVTLIAVATVVGSAAYNLFWNNLGMSDDTGTSVESRLTAATSLVKG